MHLKIKFAGKQETFVVKIKWYTVFNSVYNIFQLKPI
jgi:hypothetical protein